MLSSTVLMAEDITEIINLKGKEKGIEVTHIEITNGIEFRGKIRAKINSSFRGAVYIKSFSKNKIILETQKLNITSLGLLKGASNIILKAVVKMLGEDYINIKDNNIIIDLGKINGDSTLYNTSISDLYIKDKALYIIGTNLDMYLNA
ncbi:hypothetical protein [Clostridium sp.]|uniref:hypothetical protein n=1 Tax=Clostridium sp. TaxID=1506 RepID=UPI0025C71E31|nr:hypothetical protein [Clostridium sp.]